MSKEFKHYLLLYIICALFIFGGFYLTALPVIVQILLLVAGLVMAVYTLVKITKMFLQQRKQQ